MIYLYSGFSDDFVEDIRDFLIGPYGEASEVTLLLQGGTGYENYLDYYYAPLKKNGINKIEIVIPLGNDDFIDEEGIRKIENAEFLFIGGGYTPKYAKIYCTDRIRQIIRDKAEAGKNIAGLSAGSIIMNDKIYNESIEINGLGLVKNTFIFPHFEEDQYSYDLIKFILDNKNVVAYGLETNAYLKISGSGSIEKRGKGRAFRAENNGENAAKIREI